MEMEPVQIRTDISTQWFIDAGERMARMEVALKTLVERKPCYDCQNLESIHKMKINLGLINWFAVTCVGAFLAVSIKWLVERFFFPFQ